MVIRRIPLLLTFLGGKPECSSWLIFCVKSGNPALHLGFPCNATLWSVMQSPCPYDPLISSMRRGNVALLFFIARQLISWVSGKRNSNVKPYKNIGKHKQHWNLLSINYRVKPVYLWFVPRALFIPMAALLLLFLPAKHISPFLTTNNVPLWALKKLT